MVLFHSELLSGQVSFNPLSRLLSNRHLVHLVLSGAVAIGIVGATETSTTNASDQHLSNVLRRVSDIIFLVVTVILLVYTLLLISHGVGAPSKSFSSG